MFHEVLIYNQTKVRIPRKFIRNTILRALGFFRLKQPVEMAVLIVDDEEIQRLNKTWRHKTDNPDELSFGFNSRKVAGFAKDRNDVLNLGEVVLNVKKISDRQHLKEILVHGLLHLLGYNHEKSAIRAKKMERVEKQILKNFNI